MNAVKYKNQGTMLLFTVMSFLLISVILIYAGYRVSKDLTLTSFNQVTKNMTYQMAQSAAQEVLDGIDDLSTAEGVTGKYRTILDNQWNKSGQTLIYQKTELGMTTQVHIRFVAKVPELNADLSDSEPSVSVGLYELVAVTKTDGNQKASTKVVVGFTTG